MTDFVHMVRVNGRDEADDYHAFQTAEQAEEYVKQVNALLEWDAEYVGEVSLQLHEDE